MSTLTDRPNSALIVIDVQNGVVDGAYQRDERVANMAIAVDRARAAGVPVIWVQHSDDGLLKDTDDWQIVAELTPAADEPIVHKNYRSSFEQTNLDDLLSQRTVGHLYICGAQTNYCVRNTIHAGYERGYDITLIRDAHTTSDDVYEGRLFYTAESVVTEANVNFFSYDLPGRTIRTRAAAELFA
jgi:nicotinamidase-related amidase